MRTVWFCEVSSRKLASAKGLGVSVTKRTLFSYKSSYPLLVKGIKVVMEGVRGYIGKKVSFRPLDYASACAPRV